MTPKEKAHELHDKFRNYVYGQSASPEEHQNAKKCALIAVNEVLKVAFYSTDEIYKYYLEVKQELEKL